MDRSTYNRLVSLDFEVVLQQFLAQVSDSPATRRGYPIELRKYAKWANAAGLHPLAVSHLDLNRYFENLMSESGLADSTRSRMFTVMKSFFRYVARTNQVPNPMDHPDIKSPAEGFSSYYRPPEMMDFGEYERFMRQALSAEPTAALQLALLGINGLTIQELCDANVQDLRTEEKVWRLCVARRQVGSETPLVGLETPIAKQVIAGRSHGPLNLNQWGARTNRNSVVRLIGRVCKSAGVAKTNPRALRNTAAIVAVTDGATQGAICKLLGISTRPADRYMTFRGSQGEEHAAERVWKHLHPERKTNELMDQVDRLKEGEDVAPIAPIALAGAALEQHLRRLCEDHDVEVDGQPSIDRYKGLLVKEGLISTREAARIDVWRSLRNDAAHGRDDLTRADADEMATGVRLFIEGQM